MDAYTKAEVDTALSGKSSSTHAHDDKYDVKGAASTALSQSKTYTDEKIALLLNNSSEAVDSIMELATAMKDNADAIDALETIAGNKVDKTTYEAHAGSTVSHITAAERTAWNAKASTAAATTSTAGLVKLTNSVASTSTTTAATPNSVKQAYDLASSAKSAATAVQTNLDTHAGSTVVHITDAERTTWNAKASTASATTASAGLMSSTDKSKLDGIAAGANKYTHPTTSGNKHIPSGGSSGQFLKWSEDGTAVWASDNDTKYAAGTGIALSGTTFSNSGVRSVVTGTTNGTIIVNTNGTTASVPVKGLGAAAYVGIDANLSSTSTNAVQNKAVNTAITTLTDTVTANTNSISTLTAAVGAIQEISKSEIEALFA